MANYTFKDVPVVRYNRSKFPLNQDIKTTANVGDLVPFYCQEVLPGDTFDCSCNFLARVTSSFIKAPMDTLYADVRFFFVPNRIVWDKWIVLMGENKSGFWTNEEAVQVPQIVTSGLTPSGPTQTVGDYLGLALGDIAPSRKYSQLPFRAFAQIYNDWYRDENLISPSIVTENLQEVELNVQPWSPSNIFGLCPKAAKFHDYFTSALPSPQKGNSVEIPILGNAPVFASSEVHNHVGDSLKFRNVDGSNIVDISALSLFPSTPVSSYASTASYLPIGTPESSHSYVTPSNLYADMASVTGVSVNDLRMAIQTQRLLEKDSRGGTRYNEQILAHFGVQNPDSRLQRSEYLGGQRVPLLNQEVPQTSQGTADSPQGNISSFSKTIHQGSGFYKSFTEHGFVIGVFCVRHKHTYQQGIEKFWTRKNRLDFYDPVYANIGEQPIKTTEIYAKAPLSQVFGYQEAWADYRYRPDRTSGLMRSGVTGNLAIWHFGDFYSSTPVLSKSWIEATPAFVDRTLSVPSTVAPNFILEFYVKNMATRVMPTYSVPGLVDHH